jgi:predicted alpha/beta hydrolase family esterase
MVTKTNCKIQTIILPGFSESNRIWTRNVSERLRVSGSVIVHEWNTWKNGGRFDIEQESEKILKYVKGPKVNFVAKSIGTKVLMHLIPKIKKQVNRIVLCGMPIDPLVYYNPINSINNKDLLVIQNTRDPYMPYGILKFYMRIFHPKVQILRKQSRTHEYPYYEEFNAWISSGKVRAS